MLADTGILPGSSRYYHEADSFAESCLYFASRAGIYHCNSEYEVKRDYLDVCQLIRVDEGQLYIEYDGETCIASAGSLVLFDCRKPHRYAAASEELHIRWFQFSGKGSEAYTGFITQTRGIVLPMDAEGKMESCISQLMTAAQQKDINVHVVSVCIHTLLALLAQLPEKADKSEIEQVIDRSVAYIETHFGDSDLSNDSLAHLSAFSPSYFIRQFKDICGITPHQYIQTIRIRSARRMLDTTSRSIEDIAEICGFSNASHFIMVFKRMTGMTPLQFRMMWR